MKKIQILLVVVLLFLAYIPARAQCPSGDLSLTTLPAGVKVVITEISKDDEHFDKKKKLLGQTVTLTSTAKIDNDCWYEGSYNSEGMMEWFNYFRFTPVSGEQYEVLAPTPEEVQKPTAPMEFDKAEMEKFINAMYQSFLSGFMDIKGEYGNFLYGYKSTLQFPGAEDTRLSVAGDSICSMYVSVGSYATLHEGFIAYENLFKTLKQIPVYISPFSDAAYTFGFVSKPVESDTAVFYTNVAFLGINSGFGLVTGDEDMEILFSLSPKFGAQNGFDFEVSFINKTKCPWEGY